ncbi:FtsX-like permease family protein [Tamaricihabitans halophyticus]|uniref:FtsX-like permease family protein n=1 Tax=Tamaricihabitans halophyticus TaxID=1262583 RepID=A0A4R2QVP1_9PSEU|nr:FtsX-like permease family protein [Tamaricihabitans halophyticus]TCP52948.1 FtsX-like permease family protein [Tamaricihabitans halophyticus]
MNAESRYGARNGRWWGDLALGIRLAVGGARTLRASVLRLGLSAFGIGLAVALLLIAAGLNVGLTAQDDRSFARLPAPATAAEDARLYAAAGGTTFEGRFIEGDYFEVTGANPPVPPGLARIPAPGEIVLSPALAELLDSPEGAALRPRFDERVVGTIGNEGLTGPTELIFYAGSTGIAGSALGAEVPGFGQPQTGGLAYGIVLLIALGAVVLLVPLFVFVATSSRIAGAERDRSLAALRLVGADGRQTRRIAAAEALLSSVVGLALGAGLFLLARQAAPELELGGRSMFPADIVPPWYLVLLIVLAIPLLAVATAVFGMRRAVIEPLGVLRRAKPVQRRLWWRLGLLVLGVGLLGTASVQDDPDSAVPPAMFGAVVFLVAVPVLLPWVIERVMARVRGGSPSWQLASRRLQLDSGTPARVVAGIVVVLAGVVGLQTSMAGLDSVVGTSPAAASNQDEVEVTGYAEDGALAERLLSESVDVERVRSGYDVYLSGQHSTGLYVADCQTLRLEFQLPDCRDGAVFQVAGTEVPAGSTGQLVALGERGTADSPQWTVPESAGAARPRDASTATTAQLLATPGALAGVDLSGQARTVRAELISPNPEAVDRVRNALAPLDWRASITFGAEQGGEDSTAAVRAGLYAGTGLLILLAGVSLLVLAIEQVKERRRVFAVLSASGVPRGVLARSLLWQNAVPIGIGGVLAVGTGLLLARLVLGVADAPMVLDWSMLGTLGGAAVLLVLLVTAGTYPALRSATRLAALRAE